MSSRTAKEDHHHQATRLDPYHLQLSRIQPLDMSPKRTSTSATPAMTQAFIWQLVVDSVTTALEVQAATMASTDNPNRNFGPRETSVARKCTYKHNCTEDCKVKYATGTLTKDALSWWNSYAKPIGIEKAEKIAWTELKRLLTNKNTTNDNNYHNNHNNHYHHQQNRRQETVRAYAATPT
uniref:Reverse transcriptase domain-containing protein n=1 Tax=Tanacetum cinerariifolium TaxID=118510 RepID=A0A6L2KBF4_TANCI|nr:reverse transcriptase domain-containing protein [Tanacetum cinerariifolium]